MARLTRPGYPGSIAAIVLCSVGLCSAALLAQSRRPMGLVALAEIPRVLDVQLSPDGQTVSYMLARADWKANRQVPHIWLQGTRGGSPVQLTTGDPGESVARWAPDSRSLLFLGPGEGGLQILVIPAAGGPPRQVTRHASGVYGGGAPVWSPDGAFIYFLATDPQSEPDRNRTRLRDDAFAFEENYRQRHLWRVRLSDGHEQKLTDGAFSVLSFRLSRDGTRTVEHRAPTPLAGDNRRGEVWIADAAGGNARAVTHNDIEEIEAELSPDNTRLFFVAEASATFEPYFASSLFVVPASGGTPRALTPSSPYAIEHAAWSPDGTSILAVVNQGVHSEVFRIDASTGAATPLTDGRHSVQTWSVSPTAGQMVFLLDEPERLGDAWTLPVDGGTPTRVTGVYDTLGRDFALPRQEKVTWSGADGTPIEGLLFYPEGYEAGRRYPLVVQLHGGPQESDRFGYGVGVIMNYVPVLTAKGYAVFRPNYRGSTGYGSAFFRDVAGGYFRNMHLDVMTGVDALVKSGIADPDRLAVMGWSAGGHLTNKLITFTDRFKAASSGAAVANWTSFFAQTDTRSNKTFWFGGLPWDKDAAVETFWNNSPIRDASRVKTPTLLFAGAEDTRVPMAQAVEMYRALKANGVATRLYIAPREPHQWSELRHQLFKANAELEWFERRLMNRSYAWEQAPGDPPASPAPPPAFVVSTPVPPPPPGRR